MSSATALSYLVAGFAGVVILVYFMLNSARALRLLATSTVHGFPESTGTALGDLGFVIPVLVYLSLLAADGLPWAGGLLAGCSILVVVNLWDDCVRLDLWWRFAGQILAVAIAVWFAQSALADDQWHWAFTLCVAGAVLWHLRLFSRRGDIDGLCAAQCLMFCISAQVLTLGIPGWIGDLTWLLAGTALGFLVYGWPPARVRMGQVGSAYLGLLLAVIALYVWRSELLPLVACLILLAGFWFDACYTGCARILSGYAVGQQRADALIDISEARRRPLVNKVADRKGPLWTNVVYLVFGVCWLMPLAWLASLYAQLQLLWLLLAILPMIIAVRMLNAGTPAPAEG